MRMKRKLGLFHAMLLLAALGAAEPPALLQLPGTWPTPFSQLVDVQAKKLTSAEGEPALQLDFGTAYAWPGLRENLPRNRHEDWSAHRAFAATLENPGSEPVTVFLRLDSPGKGETFLQGGETIPPHSVRRVMFMIATPIPGMKGQPPADNSMPGDLVIKTTFGSFDPARITGYQIFLMRPTAPHTLILHKLELLGDAKTTGQSFPLADRFGQYTGADWPGKIHDESEFLPRRRREEKDLASNPPPGDRNAYGGWAAGPALKATGRFYAARHQGQWWLVDPAGRLFWSFGMHTISCDRSTEVKTRRNLFSWLPGEEDPLNRMYTGENQERYNFYGANLYRKFGPDFERFHYDLALNRLLSWGFNTVHDIGPRWEQTASRKKIPYVLTRYIVNEVGKDRRFAVRKEPGGGDKFFVDPFDPDFAPTLEKSLGTFAAYRDDPCFLGVLIDNEPAWGQGSPQNPRSYFRMSARAFEAPAEMPVKKALLAETRRLYPQLDQLNQLLQTNFGSWEELAEPLEFTAEQRVNGEKLFARLDYLIADRYFSACKAAMEKVLPGTLYLGCEFAGFNEEQVKAAARHCDIVSFNIYRLLPVQKAEVFELAAKYDFGVMITEFHFGAVDRGMFSPGLVSAPTQSERARQTVDYLNSALKNPNCVGAHWFQYADQPLTGRQPDGENYGVGFVNVSDEPYPEMVGAAREAGSTLYQVRKAAPSAQ